MQPARRRARISWISIGAACIGAAAVAYGATFVLNTEGKKPPAVAAAQPSAAPVKAPVVKFLGASKVTGKPVPPPDGLKGDPVDTFSDDAMVVWLKVTTDGPLTRDNSPLLMITDDKNRFYSFSPDRRSDGLIPLHLKKGYDRDVKTLSVTAIFGQESIGHWPIKDVPAPEVAFPDGQAVGSDLGEIVLRPGRRTRMTANIEMKPLGDKSAGFVLVPIAESHVTLDPKRYIQHFLAKPGEEYKSPINLPNATMNQGVMFDLTTYKGVTDTETVTFHNVHLESKFGQPTLIVDADQVGTTDKGHKVKLGKQDNGPFRTPRHVHPYASLRVSFDAEAGADANLPFIKPAVVAEVANPLPSSLGLQAMPIVVDVSASENAEAVFQLSPPVQNGKSGDFKFGPIGDLTIRLTVLRAKSIDKKRIFLPIRVSTETPQGGPGLGRPMTPRTS